MTISFFILSYNRPDDTIAAVDNVLNFLDRPEEIFLEVIVVNNNSSVDYSAFEQFIAANKSSTHHEVLYIKNTENLGVAGGRNQAMELAKGEILISLDDDAEFREPNLIAKTLELFKKYEKENVLMLTFKVVEKYEDKEFIASKAKNRFDVQELYTTFYAGGAHALKRALLDEVGMYEVGGQYGAEEYDLSYKLLEKGFKIVHTNELSILHKKNPAGRSKLGDQYGMLLMNKSLIAHKYLPRKYFRSHLFYWSLLYLQKSNFNLLGLRRYISKTNGISKQIKATPISQKTQDYILSIGGRLTY